VRTDDLIVDLVRGVHPVMPLAPPLVRLARWTAVVVPVAALGAVVIGLRGDVQTAVYEPVFLALAAVTLVMALLSAAGAFMLSVPGAERSPLLRVVPIVAGLVWAGAWVVLLAGGADPVGRVLALPVHVACVIEIAGVGVFAGWALVAMLRRAAPLQRDWSAALASLAAAGLGATATHFICPVDDPAHQLVGHVVVVMLASVVGVLIARRSLDWLGELNGARARMHTGN
jgi:hypothetical protein